VVHLHFLVALGLIKGSQRPVAILCTSGTAAANYTPAIAESQISRIPLIVLTCASNAIANGVERDPGLITTSLTP
jgi:thiamine pyrophosphate-dependent acetolactate synthase large subunit-like protein